MDKCITKYDWTKYLELFQCDGKDNRTFGRIRHLIILKRNISDVYSHNYTKIKINSDDDFSLETILNMHNAVTIINVLNKNHKHYYYQVFLEKYIHHIYKIYINLIYTYM